jgi:methionyl-tRNA formyltransferase
MNRDLRIGWMGFHREGLPAFEAVLEAGQRVHCAVTLTDGELAGRSGAADYGPACAAFDVPLRRIRNVNDEESIEFLREADLDILFVIGWSQIVRRPAMRTIRIGLIGAHASRLPHNRGSAPINWALIGGETEAGNTLIWLAEDVDGGDIIDTRAFPITVFDTCASLYEQVASSNREMILDLWPRLLRREFPRSPQPASDQPILPRRRPADGLLDWKLTNVEIYDKIRALTRPYPGAFTWLDGHKWMVWSASLLPAAVRAEALPGQVVGSVSSPEPAACGLLVATGEGLLVALELEGPDGSVLRGPELAQCPLQGGIFTHGV